MRGRLLCCSCADLCCCCAAVFRYYRSVVCALALAATASLRAQSIPGRSTQAAATLHLQAAKVSLRAAAALLVVCLTSTGSALTSGLEGSAWIAANDECCCCKRYINWHKLTAAQDHYVARSPVLKQLAGS
jgi:hypothetical protein